MLLEEICCQRRQVAGGDIILGKIYRWRRYDVDGGDMLTEEIFCRRKYVSEEDILLVGDMLPKEICCWKRYVARGDAMLKKVSSQRKYLAKGSI